MNKYYLYEINISKRCYQEVPWIDDRGFCLAFDRQDAVNEINDFTIKDYWDPPCRFFNCVIATRNMRLSPLDKLYNVTYPDNVQEYYWLKDISYASQLPDVEHILSVELVNYERTFKGEEKYRWHLTDGIYNKIKFLDTYNIVELYNELDDPDCNYGFNYTTCEGKEIDGGVFYSEAKTFNELIHDCLKILDIDSDNYVLL